MGVRVTLAAFVALFAVAATGREPDVEGLKAYAALGYTIISREEDTARRIPTQIAMIDAVLAKLLTRDARTEAAPTYLFLVPQNLWTHYLRPALGVDEDFVAGRFANYLLINNCRCDSTALQASVYNQYAHLYLRQHFGGVLPLWFEVGVARVAKLTEFINSRAYIGTPFGLYQGWMPIDQLLRLEKTSPEYRSRATTLVVHDESWALAYRMISDPAFGRQMAAFLQALDELKPIEEGVQSSFGMSVEQFNRDLFLYTRGSAVKIVSVTVELPPPATLEPGRDMSRLEAFDFLADVMFASEAKRERLLGMINALQRIAPDSSQVRVLRLRLAARDREDPVIDWLLGKLEPNLADLRVARGVGLALFERVRERRADDSLTAERTLMLERRALELLDGALRAQPDDPEAAWAFGMLAASTKQQLGSALQRLLSASENMPKHADLAMATALVYESRQQQDQMISHLADTARFARSAEQRTWARTRLEEAKKSISQ
jgi:hypothetical protein